MVSPKIRKARKMVIGNSLVDTTEALSEPIMAMPLYKMITGSIPEMIASIKIHPMVWILRCKGVVKKLGVMMRMAIAETREV